MNRTEEEKTTYYMNVFLAILGGELAGKVSICDVGCSTI